MSLTVDLLGFKHHPLYREASDALRYGLLPDWFEECRLVRDKHNAYDRRAIAVDREGRRLAFVSADSLDSLLQWLDENGFGDDLSEIVLAPKRATYDAGHRLVRLSCECLLD